MADVSPLLRLIEGVSFMTDAELTEIIEGGGKVPVPYFDNALIEIMNDTIDDRPDPIGVVTPDEALVALKNFLQLTADQRRADVRHLLAYLKMMVDAIGEEDVLEDLGGVMPTVDTIWTHAEPKFLFFGDMNPGKYATQRTIYLQIEGNVAWEPEHGLQMSWENGSTLVKAGAYDGHPTNGHAFANPDYDAYVFYCSQPEHSTKREGD